MVELFSPFCLHEQLVSGEQRDQIAIVGKVMKQNTFLPLDVCAYEAELQISIVGRSVDGDLWCFQSKINSGGGKEWQRFAEK
ncbi:hypothetical protein VNO77_24397 [Canavalia gladiata]|uniref:Uncharacterized protein n=1 Tax=Canavalia gladiata TaxID=3824 RepID=A0AAN9L680_CANGL